MSDDLLRYYNDELAYLRRLGAEFAKRYPGVARRLELEESRSADPHVERLLEGFAFLAARTHRRLDDDLPEVSEALLDVLHPQHVRPIPALTMIELELNPELGNRPGGVRVPRESELQSRPVNGMPCRFRTCYDTLLWPLTVGSAEWTTPDRAGARVGEAVAAVRVELRALPGMRLDEITIGVPEAGAGGGRAADAPADALRFHLGGNATAAATLYELLVNSCLRVVVRDPDQPSRRPMVLAADAVRPTGLEENQSLLPYPRRAFAGFTLLQELFILPQKYLFVDVAGVAAALRALEAGPRAELYFVLAPFERAERRRTVELALASEHVFRLGCTPVVNLFRHTADGITLTERLAEYPVVPDARQRLEIETWSVESVVGDTPSEGGSESRPIEPLYGFRHGRGEVSGVFWHAVRRPTGWRTERGTEVRRATEVFLSFADRSGRGRAPDAEVVTPRLLCFNGDLPHDLPFGEDPRGDFELMQGGPVRRITCLTKPTKVVQPELGKPLLWRLISSLSLNHLSLVEGGTEALRELLRLHNAGGSAPGEKQILGLAKVQSAATYARVPAGSGDGGGVAFARGRRVELEFDEEHFPGGEMFLFASVLERFLALYVSMNTFTQLVVRSQQRKRPVRTWAPRAGWRTLL